MRKDTLLQPFLLVIILLFASCRDDDEGGVLFPNGSRELTLDFDYAFSSKKTFCLVSTEDRQVVYDTVFINNVKSRRIKVPDQEDIHVTIGSESEEGFAINTFTYVEEYLKILPHRFLSCDNVLHELSNKIEKRVVVINNINEAQLIQSIFTTIQPQFSELNKQITFEGFMRELEVNEQVHSHLMAIQEEGSDEVKGCIIDIGLGADTIFLDFDTFGVLHKHVFNMEEIGQYSMKCIGVNEFGTVDLGYTSFYPPTGFIDYYLPENIDVDMYELFLRGTIDEGSTISQEYITILELYDELPGKIKFDFGKIADDGSTIELVQYKAEDSFDYLSAIIEYGNENNVIPTWTVHFINENRTSASIPEIPNRILSEFSRIKSKHKNPIIISFESSKFIYDKPEQFVNTTLEKLGNNCHYRTQRRQRFSLK